MCQVWTSPTLHHRSRVRKDRCLLSLQISMVPVEHMLGARAGSGRGDGPGFVGLDLHADSAGGGVLATNLALEVSQGPIVSLTGTHTMGNQVELQS